MADKVQPSQIRELIDAATSDEAIFHGKEVVVSYRLPNGFTVSGRGACVDPANFDLAIGRQIARERAEHKLWELEGYLLQQRLHERQTETQQKVELAARIAHEVNRAYCASLGDDSQVPWADAPEWQKNSARDGVAVFVTKRLPPEQMHENWRQHKERDGWVYGTVKDAAKKTHPCMVPYHQLPDEQKLKDHLFRAVMVAVFGT